MPTIAEIELLPDADGRVLIFIRHAPPDPALDTAQLIRPDGSFLGLSFEQLAAAGAGRIIPDGKGGARIEAGSPTGRRSDQRRRWRARLSPAPPRPSAGCACRPSRPAAR
jgi:hypothetical protein